MYRSLTKLPPQWKPDDFSSPIRENILIFFVDDNLVKLSHFCNNSTKLSMEIRSPRSEILQRCDQPHQIRNLEEFLTSDFAANRDLKENQNFKHL